MSELTNISVVLPSLDPDEKLGNTISGLLEQGFTDIILVNDGSKPENLHYFEEAARDSRIQLLHHEINKGKGAALKTAFNWFLQNRPEGTVVVTVDGDGQHHPEDTKACAINTLKTGKILINHCHGIAKNFQALRVKWCYTNTQHVSIYTTKN